MTVSPLRLRIATVRALSMIAAVVSLCTSVIAGQSQVEPLNAQIGRAVFRLEHQETVSRPGQAVADILLKSDGTAFLVTRSGVNYLVTARHVVERPYDLQARVPSKLSATEAINVVELRIPKESWTFHERGPDVRQDGGSTLRFRGVDVAVAELPILKDRSLVAFEWCNPCDAGRRSQLVDNDPLPPLSVLIRSSG